MNCPVCGEPIESGRPKCLRCGYEFKSLIISNTKQSESDSDEYEDDTEYKEIDPDNIFMGNHRPAGAGSIFDELFGGSIFGSSRGGGGGLFGGGLFGGFSSIIDDLFGGIFGSGDDDDEYDNEIGYADEFGNPIPIDVFDRDFVEVAEIEEYDSEGNLKAKQNQKEHKGFFKRKKSGDDKK